ncbi:MAG: hypothetical protein BWY94_02518 [Actinobacteria bacterium ADurb.BinA094]|nr:MAG: hypothetical protein BWY94_02518 [Actinobacteria bacterium ADurb.BinA094]
MITAPLSCRGLSPVKGNCEVRLTADILVVVRSATTTAAPLTFCPDWMIVRLPVRGLRTWPA